MTEQKINMQKTGEHRWEGEGDDALPQRFSGKETKKEKKEKEKKKNKIRNRVEKRGN